MNVFLFLPRCLRNICKFLLLLIPLLLLLGESSSTSLPRWLAHVGVWVGDSVERAGALQEGGERARGLSRTALSPPGAGLSLWGQGGPLSFLPVVNWTHVYRAQRADGPESSFSPASPHPSPPLEVPASPRASHGPAPPSDSSCRLRAGCAAGRPVSKTF